MQNIQEIDTFIGRLNLYQNTKKLSSYMKINYVN